MCGAQAASFASASRSRFFSFFSRFFSRSSFFAFFAAFFACRELRECSLVFSGAGVGVLSVALAVVHGWVPPLL